MIGALTGKTIVNTRATHQAMAFNTLLQAQGAITLNYPCIAITPPEDCTQLDAALVDLAAGCFDWLVLTSANTVLVLSERLKNLGLSLPAVFRTAVVGPGTAAAAREYLGLQNTDLPAEYLAEALADSLPVATGTRILLPESAIACPTLAAKLAERGAVVTVVAAYRTVCGQGGADVPRRLAQRQIDALTFTSSSTVTYFLERLDREGGREDAFSVCAACIGPQTAATARDSGFAVLTVPAEHTLAGLVQALGYYFENEIRKST